MLYGMALAAIPVILHLLMRSKPKKFLFPALRLIQERRKTNSRRLRLKHFWLLLMRILVICLLVLAIARPSLPAANYMPNTTECLLFGGIMVLLIVAYFLVMKIWQQTNEPEHVLAYRKSYLRSGLGILGLILLLLLVAWPYQQRIAAEIAAPVRANTDNLPVAGVFLFDTSLSMSYRQESQTRLEVAAGIATRHLSNLPRQSRIAVADSASNMPMLFQADLVGAQSRIESLTTQPVSLSLDQRIRDALSLQEEDRNSVLETTQEFSQGEKSDRYLREIYVFTDLARSGWKLNSARILKAEMERLEWVHVYLIDIGVEEPRNVGLTELRLDPHVLTRNSDLHVHSTLKTASVKNSEHVVEIYTQNASGNLVKQGQNTIALTPESQAEVSFTLQAITDPYQHGEIRLVSSDPMSFDDVQYFTVDVLPPPEILLVAPDENDIVFWRDALAPEILVRQNKARFRCTYQSADRFQANTLAQYDVLCLMNVRNLTTHNWESIGEFVKQGGGLAVFLGMPNTPDAKTKPASVVYNDVTAQNFLPAELLADLRFRDSQRLDFANPTHPILKKFIDFGGFGELTQVDVDRYWRVKPNKGSTILGRYTDDRSTAALLERPFGRGSTLLFTTSVDLQGWAELPMARWAFVAFADQMMQYLSRIAVATTNYTSGETVSLPLKPDSQLKRYLLRMPELQQLPGEVNTDSPSIQIANLDQLGHYQVISAENSVQYNRGFSINPDSDESDLTRLNQDDLTELFGENRFHVARQISELERAVHTGRLGIEAYPAVVLFLAVCFCLELLLANRFYNVEQLQRA